MGPRKISRITLWGRAKLAVTPSWGAGYALRIKSRPPDGAAQNAKLAGAPYGVYALNRGLPMGLRKN
jgi:hypothetical protein